MTSRYLSVLSGSGSGWYPEYSYASIVAFAPNPGSKFDHWKLTGCSLQYAGTVTPNYVVMSIQVTQVAEAIYSLIVCTLTYSAGTGGSISGKTPQPVTYGNSGEAVTAVPSSGYHFVKWSDNNFNATRSDRVYGNVTYTATFALDVTNYTLTVNTGANGTPPSTGGGSYPAASVVAIVAGAPSAGYGFLVWTGNTTGIDNLNSASTHIHTAAANATITATYVLLVDPKIKKVSGVVRASVKKVSKVVLAAIKKLAGVPNS